MHVRMKGAMKRTPAQQVALAVRILDERHFDDVYDRAKSELGDRREQLGPLDLTRNPLRAYVDRVNRAHQSPPLASGLARELASLVGDQSGSVVIDRYAAGGGHPLPTDQALASTRAQAYRMAAGYAGVLLGWSERAGRFFLTPIAPDDLEVVWASDDPDEPTIIRHARRRDVDGGPTEVVDEYDLTDPEAPVFRVLDGEEDVTARAGVADLKAWPWRYSDGTPWHRIVITGDDSRPYRTNSLIEATLRVAVLYTHWGAGVRDAGHPQRNAVGLRLAGMDSDSDDGQTGVAIGPGDVLIWEHEDPERPGSLHQWGPGFDPEVVGRAIRQYELGAMSALGLPVDYESTGGDPTEQERQALEELIASTYPECRRLDSEILRRLAAMANAMGLGAFSEEPYGVLYRTEVTEALGAAAAAAAEQTNEETEDGGRDESREPADADPGPDGEGDSEE